MSAHQQLLQSSLQEIQELKELCCYLHDERAKLINLVSEWKKFGKHIFGTMQIQKETYRKEIADLEIQERHLLNELHSIVCKTNMSSGGNIGNFDLENIRKGGDGSSRSSPTNINDFKKNDIYLNPRDAISTPANLDSYQKLPKYDPQSTYLPSYEYGRDMSSEYATINTINAYDIKKFHHSMPRHRLNSNSTMRSSYGSDKVPVGAENQLHKNFNNIQYPSNGPKYRPSFNETVHPQNSKDVHNQFKTNAGVKYQSSQLTEDERAVYRNMCKSVWQNLGKSTTYKTAV